MASQKAGSVSDQKLKAGETRVSNQSGESSTTLGFGSSAKRIKGQPSLVRQITDKDGNDVTIDAWTNIMKGTDVARLEIMLTTASTDLTYDMTSFIHLIEYQGFDREFYVRFALSIMSISTFSRFAVLGALRGSNFKKIQETCEGVPQDLITAFTNCGFVKTPKKKKDVTILRNTACIPHWCAFWFIKADVGKKIPASECPASLQFPGAASLPMSKDVRIKHMDFCQKFSSLLPGGNFNLNIYVTAYNNPIPFTDIPEDVKYVLGISAASESHAITEDDLSRFSQAIVPVKRQ